MTLLLRNDYQENDRGNAPKILGTFPTNMDF